MARLANLQEENALEKRLAAVQKAVWQATEEAIKAAQSEEPVKFKSSSTGSTGGSTENDDPNVSFALGMTLFGQETTVVEREIQKKLKQIENELKDVVLTQQVREPADEDDYQDDDDEIDSLDPVTLEAQAEKLTRQIAFLRECSAARSFLDDATFHQDWIQSASILFKAQTSLSAAEGMVKQAEEANAPHLDKAHHILDSMRVPIRRKRVQLVSKAEALVRSCITVSPMSLSVRSPAEAFDVLESLGNSLDVVRRLADDLNLQVFQPLLEDHRNGTSKGSWTFREKTVNESLTGRQTKGPVNTLEWSSQSPNSGEPIDDATKCLQEQSIASWGDTLAFMQKIMSFVQKRALLERTPLCAMVGQRLFGKPSKPNALNLEAFGLESSFIGDDTGLVMKPMVPLMWDTCIPSTRWDPDQCAKLPSMEVKLRGFIEPFERALLERHLLSSQSPLSDFCSNFEQKHAEKRRSEILGEARDLLLNNDYHNTTQVGLEIQKGLNDDVLGEDGISIFQLQQCSISFTSSKIFSMCRNTMDEAVVSSAVLAPMLYRTAREILDLFRAVIPASHSSEVAKIPRTAAVLHNDCVFFAHECLTLGLVYKEKFSQRRDTSLEELRKACMFVDMVPPFRELANRSLGDMMEKQQATLWDIVGSRITLLGDAMRENEDVAEWTDAETALTAGLNHLRHLSQAWKPILSREIYTRSIGHLVDTIFHFYLMRIMEAKVISAPACHFASALFQNATRGMSELVESSPMWGRFTAIGRFMDMSLADIQTALAEGKFRSVTAQELSKLITATFDKSQKRENVLQLLSTHHQR